MKNLIIFLLFTFYFLIGTAQTATHRITGNKTRVYNPDGTPNEFILENATKSKAGAFLRNRLNGETDFEYVIDSLRINGDSIFFRKNGMRYLKLPSKQLSGAYFKDSAGFLISLTDSLYINGSDLIWHRRNGQVVSLPLDSIMAAADLDTTYFNPTAVLTQATNKRLDDSIKLVTNTALALKLDKRFDNAAFINLFSNDNNGLDIASWPYAYTSQKNGVKLKIFEDNIYLKSYDWLDEGSTNGMGKEIPFTVQSSDTTANALLQINKTTGVISKYSGYFPAGSPPTTSLPASLITYTPGSNTVATATKAQSAITQLDAGVKLGKDSIDAHTNQLNTLKSNVAGKIDKSDSTLYSTKANTTKAKDSVQANITITRSTNQDSLIVGTGKVRDKDDPLNSAWYLRNNLKWIEYWQRQKELNLQDFTFALLGDSKTEYGVIPSEMIAALGAKVKVMGQGYIPLAPQFTGLFNSVLLSTSATNWTLNSNGRNLAFYSITSTASSVSLGWTINSNTVNEWNRFNNLEVGYWGQAGGGNFDIYVDGTLRQSVNTSLTTGLQTVVITGLTDAPHSVTIDPTSAGAELLHIKPYRTTINTYRGYFNHSIGHAGAMFSNYLAVDTAIWNPQFRNLNINLLSIYLGTNERHNLVSLSTFKANAKTLISRLKALNRQMDIVLWGQVAENDADLYFAGAIATAAQYNEVLRQVAIEDTLAFFDIDKLAGAYSVNNTKQWLTDGIHEGNFGAYAESVNFINGLPSLGNQLSVANKLATETGLIAYNNGGLGSGLTAGSISGNNITATGTSGSNISGTQFSSSAGNVNQTAGTSAIQMNWLTSSQAAIPYNFRFSNFYGEGQVRGWDQSSNFMRFYQSWNAPNGQNLRGAQIFVGGDLNMANTSNSNTAFTQHYLAMTATALGRTKLRAYRNDIGDNFLNVLGGSLNIGKDTTGLPSAILNVNGNNGLNYRGSMPAPRLTTAQRDSIVRGIAFITVTGGGASYSPTPTITFTPASDAAATASISSGVLAGISVEKAGGFVTPPTVNIVSGGAGSGATATATLMELPNGLIIFNTTTNQYEVRDSVAATWVPLAKSISASSTTTFTGSTYTVTASNRLVIANYTGGTATITLPAASTMPYANVRIKNISSTGVTISGLFASDANIMGGYAGWEVVNDGTTWYVMR